MALILASMGAPTSTSTRPSPTSATVRGGKRSFSALSPPRTPPSTRVWRVELGVRRAGGGVSRVELAARRADGGVWRVELGVRRAGGGVSRVELAARRADGGVWRVVCGVWGGI